MSLIPAIEFQPFDKIKLFQEERLQETLLYVTGSSPFYKSLFTKNSIDPLSIRKLEDLPKIPVTTKDVLQAHNWEFLCVPGNKIAEYTSTSGTLGKPVTVALTEKDLERLAYNEAISFACADGTAEDLYQLTLTLDRQFMAGIAYYEGIRRLGAGLVRVGPGLPAMQWETIERLKPTTLVSVPSFLAKLIEYAEINTIDIHKSSIKKAICIGESLRNADLQLNTLGKKIADAWDIHLYSTYASTEMQTAFTECTHGKGGHHHPELIIVELLDEHNDPVKKQEPGEVTITTLGIEGMPLIRYKTGDVATAYEEPCSCGRTTLRLGPILGRKQHMIKLKGTTIYPSGIFEILHQISHVRDYVVEAFTGNLGTDELKLHVVVEGGFDEQVRSSLTSAFQSQLRVVPEIVITTPQNLDLMQFIGESRKARKFLDTRK
jgi:phenylacetate-CoA ligase